MTHQLTRFFELLPDGVLCCDLAGKIRHINGAALALFELESEHLYTSRAYFQFMNQYEIRDEQQRPIPPEQWPISFAFHEEDALYTHEKNIVIYLPSGNRVYVNVRRIPIFDVLNHPIGVICIFHDLIDCHQTPVYQIQRVHQALLTLTDAVAHIPEQMDTALPQRTLLLPPLAHSITQHLVDLIRQVLGCDHVFLLALGPPRDHLYYIAMSGLTLEQTQRRLEITNPLFLSQVLDEASVARLYANKELIIPRNKLNLPISYALDFGFEIDLFTPIFLRDQLAGLLVIDKPGCCSDYTQEEISLARAVTDLTILIIECTRFMSEWAETHTRERVLQETNHLMNDFLTLASHELRTPLTTIMGNIQLVQRRLQALQPLIAKQSEVVSEKIAHAQHSLEYAAQSAHLQEQMINYMIDDSCIQANKLFLHLKPCDLLVVIREAIAALQHSVPERTIDLKISCSEKEVPILADIERIKQVLNTYLTNAINYSPVQQPVTVQLNVGESVAQVSVHDKGPGIPIEEQECLWKRFYRAKGIGVQHELDLSLGLGLYICRALIECHGGRTGVQSLPGHGATFWFTLPIKASPEDTLA